MARSSRGVTLLFWLMALTGIATLAACLILPPWVEHQAALQLHTEARRHVAQLEARLQILEKQIAHLRNDAAYVERLAHEEFGLTTPGVQTILLERAETPATQPGVGDHATKPPMSAEEQTADLSTLVAEALERRPLVSVFVLDQTRPIVMAMSGLLLLAAMLLLRGERS